MTFNLLKISTFNYFRLSGLVFIITFMLLLVGFNFNATAQANQPVIQVSSVTGTIKSCEGTPSYSESFTISGANLSADITITAPVNFEVSLNGINGYREVISLPAPLGSISNTTVFVRSSAKAPHGSVSGSITCASGTLVKQVALSGIINKTPVITNVNSEPIDSGRVLSQTIAPGQTGYIAILTGDWDPETRINWVTDNSNIEHWSTSVIAGISRTLGFRAKNTTSDTIKATVTITPSTATCTGPSINYYFIITPSPSIMANSNLSADSVEFGSLPPSQSFTVSGVNLSAGITAFAPNDFEISQNNSNFSSSIFINAFGSLDDSVVYFRLKPGLSVNTYTGTIILSSPSATSVSVALPSFTVTPAPLTITADDVTKTYGEVLQNKAASAAFKITQGSLKNGNTLTSVAIGYGIGAAGNAAVGSYLSISALVTSGGNGFSTANYALTYVNGKITVLPAILTVTAVSKTKIYRATNPTLTIKYSGFVNNENAGSLLTIPGIKTTAQQESPVGDYPIVVSGGSSDNYNIIYVNGVLSIVLVPLEIVVPNAFTPNGDGINDLWDIPALAAHTNCVVKVYARSGNLVFQSVGYSKPWNGNYGNALLPTGIYYYIIIPGKNQKTLSGSLTLIR